MKSALIGLIIRHNNAFNTREYIIFLLSTQAQNLTKQKTPATKCLPKF